MRGRIFAIEEFAVYDGPGIRTTVFFKGCPLRCAWCHNPEGLDFEPVRVTQLALCAHCGACDAACPSIGKCIGCESCARACPKRLIHIAGLETDNDSVAARVMRNAELLNMNGGGVTFSGGEPLAQLDFLLALRSSLAPLHACMETSGYASLDAFQTAAKRMDLVIMDIKLVDPEAHRRYTGADNAPILRNLNWLKNSGIPFRARVPLIMGVTDTEENLRAAADLLSGAKALEMVELLPYHATAGAKYASVGKRYDPNFLADAPPNADTRPFAQYGMEVRVL